MGGVREVPLEVGWTCRSCGYRISERNCHLCGLFVRLTVINGREHVICRKYVTNQ